MQQFQINKMDPYQRQLQLKQLKSQAANQEYAQDVSNTIGSLSNAAAIGMSAASMPSAPSQRSLQRQFKRGNKNVTSLINQGPKIGGTEYWDMSGLG